MNSTKQARPTSTPKTVTFVKGVKPFAPMCNSRVSPKSKTAPKICDCNGK